VVDTYVLPHSS
jgi:hypothetical protein